MQKVFYIFSLLIGCIAAQAQFCGGANAYRNPFQKWDRQVTDTLISITYLQNRTEIPVGMIIPYAGEIAPKGWLFCDGKSLSISNYPKLYHIIGNAYGGSEECFCVPDTTGFITLLKSKPSHIYYTPAEANMPNKDNEKREVNHFKVIYIIKY